MGRFVSEEQPLSNPESAWRGHGGTGISTGCASTTPVGLALAPDLGGLAFPRNPWAFGGGVSHPSFATHTCILTRPRSTPVHTAASLRDRRSPTTRTQTYESAASAPNLSPVTLSAQDHSTSELLRTLSRVAASKPTSWLSGQSHIVYHLVQN